MINQTGSGEPIVAYKVVHPYDGKLYSYSRWFTTDPRVCLEYIPGIPRRPIIKGSSLFVYDHPDCWNVFNYKLDQTGLQFWKCHVNELVVPSKASWFDVDNILDFWAGRNCPVDHHISMSIRLCNELTLIERIH